MVISVNIKHMVNTVLHIEPKIFKHILNHLATGEFCLDFDSEEEREKFDQEIDFFVLPNFIEKLQEIFDSDPDQ